MYQDIKDRTYHFALEIITLCNELNKNKINFIISNQLLRAGISVGANVEEATAAYSDDDFVYTMNIALKEARETHYWLRLLQDSGAIKTKNLDSFISEAEEIKKILGAIVSKLRKKQNK